MKKRILATLLSLCLVIGLLPVTAMAAEDTQSITYIDANADKRTLQGAGTAEDPYRISSADDLDRIRYYVKETGIENTYKNDVPQKYESVVIDGYFKLTADIDLAGSTWVPIGWTEENKDFYAKTAFVGTFDGDGHTIKNLALGNYTPAEGEPTQYFGNGLFTRANGATIRNFTIDGVTTPDGNIGVYASAVVGVLGRGTFENITVKNAEVTVANNFGFIFADSWQYSAKDANDFVVVKNCTVENSKIHSSAGTVGFIFGRNMNNNADVPLINDIQNCTVKNCEVDAAGGYVGGLCGNLRGGQAKNCKVENVTVTQTCAVAQTSTSYSGVFAAGITGCTVINCEASGSVTSNTWNTGGFAGSIAAQGTTASNIIGCVADVEVEGKSYVGGFAGGASATFTDCHAKGDVTGTQTSTGNTETDQKLMVGGFVGNLSGGTLNGCSAQGNVTANESVALASGKNARNYRGVGGLVGNTNFKATENIIDCYATGNVSSNLYVGGLVGLPGDSSCLNVKNSYFCGTVTAQDLYGVYYGKHTTGNTYYRPKLTEGFGYTNGGLFPNGVSHEDGKLATPEKAGYTFGGWYDNEGLTGSAAETYVNDTVYYAKWVSTITFDANGGTCATPTVDVPEGKTYAEASVILPTPAKEGYTFTGWFTAPTSGTKATEDTKPSGDTTLYAQWEINKYKVTFNSDGGSDVAEQTVEHGSKATMPTAPTKEGYAFSGWYNEESQYDFDAPVTGALTLTAKWTQVQETTPKFTVTFNSNDGSAVDSAEVYQGAVVAEPDAPTREGYTFAGWLNGTAPYNFNTPVTENLTLTAKWDVNTYTVTWDVDGKTTTVEYAYGAAIALPTAPTKDGYTFIGWSGYTDGMTMPAGNVTFTAQWQQIYYGGGSSSSSNTSTSTTKNPDGSTTTTVINKTTGTVTETTKYPDGSTLVVETKKDGTVTETVKLPDGTTGTVVTDKNGEVTQVTASVSSTAARNASKTGEAVTLPVEVPAAKTTEDAPAVEVTVPKSAGSVRVEIPVEKVTPGTVAVLVDAKGNEKIVATSVTTENGVALTLDGSATVKVIDNSKSFTDVPKTNVFYNEIASLSAREIMVGKSDTTFDLYSSVTLNQIANVAGRIIGAVDVKDYNAGIIWGAENGLKTGDVAATRGDVLKALYIAAGSPTVEDTSIASMFKDSASIPADMVAIVAWAAQNGILKGDLDGNANLSVNVTRGQACALAGRTMGTLA